MYRMTCSSGLVLGLKNLVCFILGLVIDVKITETNTSFLNYYQDTC